MLKIASQNEINLLDALLKEQKKLFNQEALDHYIPPQLIRYPEDKHPEDAYTQINLWLEDQSHNTLLLLGDSGAGKTLFNQWLTLELFARRAKGEAVPIPLFIPLLAQSRAKTHLMLDYFRDTLRLDNSTMDWLEQQPLLIILEGFDELHERANLYLSNKLWKYQAKILISCRSQALATMKDYKTYFAPYNPKSEAEPQQLLEWTVAPFNQTQIDAYFKRYIEHHAEAIKNWMSQHPDSPNWLSVNTYQETLQQFLTLKEFVASPFVLSLIAQVLPEVMLKPNLKMARLHLYDEFAKQWFKRQHQKLLDAQHINIDTPIIEAYQAYSKKLAEGMLQNDLTSIELNPEHPLNWFFEDKEIELPNQEKVKLSYIRAGVPLMQIGQNHFAFLHKSLLEYFAARYLFESAMTEASLTLGLPLNEKFLVDEPDTLKFMVDQVRENKDLQQTLFNILDETKHDPRLEKAGSNAITLLHQAGVVLANRDFRGVRIPKAQLTGADLTSCDFREADLREVKLEATSLSYTQMSGTLMKDIFLGQKPKIEVGSEVNAITYSPDGLTLAAGCKDNTIKLYRAGETKPFKVLGEKKDHHEAVICLAFSPTGDTLASGSLDTTIRLWSPTTGEFRLTLSGHTSWVLALAFNPNGDTLASGSLDKSIRLWNPKTGESYVTLSEHTDSVRTLAFNSSGDTLASGSDDKTLRLWNPKTGELRPRLTLFGHTREVTTLAFNPSGDTLASGSGDNTIRLWNPKTGESYLTLSGHTGWVHTLAFNPSGDTLASGASSSLDSKDNTIRLWNPKTGESRLTLSGHTSWVRTLAFNPDGNTLASGSGDNTIRLWNPKTGESYLTLSGHTNRVNTLAFNPSGDTLASGSGDNIRLWNPMTGEFRLTLSGHTDSVLTLAFNPSGDTLASGSDNNTIRLWNPKTGESRLTLYGHMGWIQTLAFNPSGDTLASGSEDKTIRLWNPKTGELRPRLTLFGHTREVTTLAFNPSGDTLASGSRDTTIRLWNPKTGESRLTLSGHTWTVNTLGFSPNGDTLASGSGNYTIRLWNPKTGESRLTLYGHTDSVSTLAFSPNGDTLASGGADKTIRLWTIPKGQCIQVVHFKDEVRSLAWHASDAFALVHGRTIQCGLLKNQQFKPLWKSGEAYLESKSAQLGGVIDLPEEAYTLLTQEGGQGKPSTKTTEKTLEQRASVRPYDPKTPCYSLLKPEFRLTEEFAVVSMVKKKSNFHVFLVIETVEGNACLIRQADFFLDQKQSSIQVGLFAKGHAIIEMVQKSEFDIRQLISTDKLPVGCQVVDNPPQGKRIYFDTPESVKHFFKEVKRINESGQYNLNLNFKPKQDQKHDYIDLSLKEWASLEKVYSIEQQGCQVKSWKIESESAKQLIINITKDQTEQKKYANALNKTFNANSCLTWCEEKLKQIGEDVSSQTHWLDIVVALPSAHMAEDKPKSGFQLPKLKLPFFSTISTDDNNNNNNNSKSFRK